MIFFILFSWTCLPRGIVLLGKQHDAIPFMQAGRKTLADDYQYIMHGKLYKISEDSTKDSNGDSSTKVYAFSELEQCYIYTMLHCFISLPLRIFREDTLVATNSLCKCNQLKVTEKIHNISWNRDD